MNQRVKGARSLQPRKIRTGRRPGRGENDRERPPRSDFKANPYNFGCAHQSGLYRSAASTTLLTFVGHRDPSYTEPHEDGRLKGPILAVLDERIFDRVVLLVRPQRREQTERLKTAVRESHPHLAVETVELEFNDAAHHPRILAAIRPALARLRRARPDDRYTISLLSGTPEIHACWVLLVAAGEFPARLLNLCRSAQNGLAGPRQLRVLD